MRILFTGGNGFLGKQIKPILIEKGEEVIVLGQSQNSDIQVNISKRFKLPKRIDIIIHAAGKAHVVPKNESEEKDFFEINFEGTKNLCAAIDQLDEKPKSFVFISTVAVYGLDSGLQISESHPKNGLTPYAKSKIMAENWLIQWAKERNITLGILRLPLVAGKNPPGNLGKMIHGLGSGKYLSIGKADVRKSIVWAEDIAYVIPKLAEVGGIYNLTDGYHPTFGELEGVISKNLGKKLPKKIPIWLAKVLAKVGDFLGKNAPINSDKLNKILFPLTFNDSAARKTLGWKSSSVLDKLQKI